MWKALREVQLLRFRPRRLAVVAGTVALYATLFASPQVSTYPYPSGTGASTSGGSISRGVPSNPNLSRTLGTDFPAMDPNFSHRQIVARREDLKRRMIDNAARLLMLTRDLQTDLQGREATDADAKKLDEIAKLARTVRDQMRQ